MSTYNLLTPNQSDVETDITGFYLGGASSTGQGPYTAGGVTLTRDTAPPGGAWHGTAALKCVTSGTSGFQECTLHIPVAGQFVPGGPLTVSAYIYSAAGGGSLRIFCQSDLGAIGSVSTVTLLAGWNRYTVSVTLPATITQNWIGLRWDTGGTAQALTFWVDGMQVEAGGTATAWTLGVAGVEPAPTTWYVATTGNDANNGALGSPFATLGKADSVALPGDSIVVQPGTYTLASSLVTTASGNPSRRISWISPAYGAAKLAGTMNNLDLWDAEGNCCDYIGFDMSGALAKTGISNWGGYSRILHNTFHDLGTSLSNTATGAGCFDYADNTVNGNIGNNEYAYNIAIRCGIQSTSNTFYHGMYCSMQFNFLHHNIVSNCSGFGFHVFGDLGTTQNVVCANNLVFNNCYGGFQIGNSSGAVADNITLINNIIYNNGRLGGTGYGVEEKAAMTGIHNVYDHNLTFGNTTAYVLQNSLVATNQVTTAPQFINYQADGSGDYHQLRTSPTVDAGTGVLPSWLPSQFGWTTDYDGNSVPQGFGFDIGPYEFVPPLAQQPQYTIRVRNAALVPQGALAVWEQMDIVLRMNDVGKWALTVRADDPLVSYFTRGSGIIVTRDLGNGSGAQTLLSGPIWTIERKGKDNLYVLGGPTDEWWLKARKALPSGGRPFMEQMLLTGGGPSLYLRLGEASGTTAFDSSGNNTGATYTASGVTYGVAGGVTGDPDTGVTFNGSTGRVTRASTSGLPTAAGVVSLVTAIKFAANPAATAIPMQMGTFTNNQALELILNTTGTLQGAIVGGTPTPVGAALALNVWHQVIVAWDGTQLRTFVDGALYGGPTTPGITPAWTYGVVSLALGGAVTGANLYTGSMDEAAVYNGYAVTAADAAALWASFNATHSAYDTRTGLASTVMQGYVNANLASPVNVDRALTTLALATDPAIGTTVTGNARGDELLALLQQLASAGGDIGFKVVQTANGQLTFSCYQPNDKSGNAKFSQDLQNLFDYSYSLAGPNANSVMVWGGGSLTGRASVPVRDATSISNWGLVEGLLDARDTTDTATMRQRGQADVNAQSEQTNLSLTPRDTDSVQYGRDYNLGDIVAVQIDGNTIVNKIRSVHLQLDASNQELVTPGIGNPSQGEVARWFDAYNARQQALNRVQAALNRLSAAQ